MLGRRNESRNQGQEMKGGVWERSPFKMREVRVSSQAPPPGSSLSSKTGPQSSQKYPGLSSAFLPTAQHRDATPHPAPDPGSTSFLTSRLPGSTSGSEGAVVPSPEVPPHAAGPGATPSATSTLGTLPGARMLRMRFFFFPGMAFERHR